ncbi:hypothetical protein [Litchfieldia alkalitelluris]|uniref:hypothetical protein n=1 Tax=Litchfieldia alkalitelluris TaxID=304268 RepID=UPI0009985598|nr:hypothetical protein [Litchfieldia alkalitelluris]
MIVYSQLCRLFPETHGTKDAAIEFHEVYIDSTDKVYKGLYVPLNKSLEEDLKDAIDNGAIGAVWSNYEKIPVFVPNHFPLFLVDDTVKALKDLIIDYNNHTEGNRVTKFSLSFREGHNVETNTYDSAVLKEINKLIKGGDEE